MNTFMFALQGQKHIAQGNTLGNCYPIIFCSPCKGKSVFLHALSSQMRVCLSSVSHLRIKFNHRNLNGI